MIPELYMNTDKKLKVAFLWHQHQPYYKIDNEFILPWVLFHGTKDYFDLPEVLYEFPSIKQTFNFVPSLNLQIQDYITANGTDLIRRLTQIHADELNENDKRLILKYFFQINYENLLKPHARYKELHDASQHSENALVTFASSDWRDLQVWYNLAWFGFYSSKNSFINRLITKGRNFTEEEKTILISEQNLLLSRITYQYKKLRELRQIELSCSPMFHPILPLLCDSRVALESNPGNTMPDPVYQYPEDAELQLREGMSYFSSIFGEIPKGVWPSEGSVSNETLDIMCKLGIKWFASDESVLAYSVGSSYKQIDKYFPRLYEGKNGEIVGFFRDHTLSDKIGFIYSSWNENDASADFINYLLNVRNDIINTYGEDALDYAVVSVILDGENCWEFYRDNGIPFLRSLYLKLEKSDYLRTITFSEGMQNIKERNFLESINSIRAGSWINGNFNIWIGHEDDIKAWNMLSKARKEFERVKTTIDEGAGKEVLKEIMIAEGSDWFWWYGPEHHTDNKPEFDRLFRHHVAKIYEISGLDAPEEVFVPIETQTLIKGIMEPIAQIKPELDSSPLSVSWQNAGEISLSQLNSAMHQTSYIIEKIKFGYNGNTLYLGLKLLENAGDFSLTIQFKNLYILITKLDFAYELSTSISHMSYYLFDDFLNFAITINQIDEFKNIMLKIQKDGVEHSYPDSGSYELL